MFKTYKENGERGGGGVPFLKFQGKSYSYAYFTPKIKITEFILQRKVKCMVDETILENTEAEKGAGKGLDFCLSYFLKGYKRISIILPIISYIFLGLKTSTACLFT